MKNRRQTFNVIRLQRLFWLFVALWHAEQQYVYSSEAPSQAVQEASVLNLQTEVQNFPVDRHNAGRVAQQGVIGTQPQAPAASKKRLLLIAVAALFVILLRVILARIEKERKRKAEEKLQVPTEEFLHGGESGDLPAPAEEHLPTGGVSPAEERPGDIPVQTPESKQKDESPTEAPAETSGGRGEPDDEPIRRPILRGRPTGKEVRKDTQTLEPPAISEVPPGTEKQAEKEPEAVSQPPLHPPAPPSTQPTSPEVPAPPPPASTPVAPEVGHLQPSAPAPQGPVSVPTPEIPGHGAVVAGGEEELHDLTARLGVISNMMNAANMMVVELPMQEAAEIFQALKANVEGAERTERAYEAAKSQGHPNIAAVRLEAIGSMKSYLGGARDALLRLAAMAKAHGEALYGHCSQRLCFTPVDPLRKPLEEALDSLSVSMAVATLAAVGNTSMNLQEQTEDHYRRLMGAQFIDECEANDFIQAYGAVAALNSRRRTLEGLATLDSELINDILDMQKLRLTWRIQADRIPLEVDANLVYGLHSLLSETRPSSAEQPASGIAEADIQSIKDIFAQQSADVSAMASATDVEGVTAAYERAKLSNHKIKFALAPVKEKLYLTLQDKPLNKREASAASEKMAKIAETAVKDSEDFWSAAQSTFADTGGKPGEVGPNFSSGKAFLQKLATKIKSGSGEQVEADAHIDSAMITAARRYFTEPWRQIEGTAKELWVRAQELLGSAKKTKKYKLDKVGLGSSALDKKTALRAEAVAKRADVLMLRKRCQILLRIAKEIEGLERTIGLVFMFPFREAESEWTEVGRLKRRFDTELITVKDTTNQAEIPECFETLLQSTLSMCDMLESDRLAQLQDAVRKPRANLHDLALE